MGNHSFDLALFLDGMPAIVSTPIGDDLLRRFYEEWRTFFTLNEGEKRFYTTGTIAGYFALHSERALGASEPDRKEFFHVLERGLCPIATADVTMTIFKSLACAAKAVSKEVDRAISLGGRLEAAVEDSQSLVMRIANYHGDLPASPHAAEHADINFFTLLPAATEPGLQVYSNGLWKDIVTPRSGLTVIAGDLLAFSSPLAKACKHRVVNCGRNRLSISFFVNPNPEFLIKDGITAGALLEERLSAMRSQD